MPVKSLFLYHMSDNSIHPQNKRPGQGTIIAICFLAIAVLALYFGAPAGEGWPVKCPLFQLTGWQCPLCGSQRAVHELLHGNIGSAWNYNPGLWISLPYFILWVIGNNIPGTRRFKIVGWAARDRVFFTAFALFMCWGVIRNFI